MPFTSTVVARRHAEAARCERLASGFGDPDPIARLSRWAVDYRRDASLASRGRDRH